MKRRDLLRKTSASLAASTIAMGVASANPETGTTALGRGPEVAGSVLDSNDHLLSALAADGLVDSTNILAGADDVSTTVATLDGRKTPMIEVSQSVDSGDLTIRVLPELDYAYGTLEGSDGTVETYGDGVSTASCDGCYYEVCYCVEECGDYCCDHECDCVLKCECGGPCQG